MSLVSPHRESAQAPRITARARWARLPAAACVSGALALFAVGCAGESPETAAAGDVLLTWDGGRATFAEIESVAATSRTRLCRQARRGQATEGPAALIPCYEEAALGHALDELVLAELGGVDALPDLLGEEYDRLLRQALTVEFLRDLRDSIEIDDKEVEQYYGDNRDDFRRPTNLTLWNLYLRHEDPERPQATEAKIRTLKERYEAGETFEALAREASQSENRSRGGLVGTMTDDKLPPRMREIAVALQPGEVSEPVAVSDGYVLLHVSQIVPGSQRSLDDATGQIQRLLTAQRLEAEVESLTSELALPADAIEATDQEIREALANAERDLVVVDITEPVKLGDLLESFTRPLNDLREQEIEGLLTGAKALRTDQRLQALLLEDASESIRSVALVGVREGARRIAIDRELNSEVDSRLEADQETLRAYYEDNAHHYQADLSFKVSHWIVPFEDDPAARLREMEALHEELTAGALSLEQARAELGGTIEAYPYSTLDELPAAIPQKARTFLLQLGEGSGFTIPYQQDESLNLLWLEERREPRRLEYDEVAEQVRDDYRDRYAQELYEEIAEEKRRAAAVELDSGGLREALGATAEAVAGD